MIGIVGRSIAARWAGLAGSVAGLALGVALSGIAGLGLAAAYSAPDQPPRWYQSPDVVVAGPRAAGISTADPDGAPGNTALPPGERGHVPAEAATRSATVDGVDEVVVDRAGYARLGPASEAHPWPAAALHPHTFVAGGPPAADDQVVVAGHTSVRPGDRVTVDTVDGPREFTVSGVLHADAPPALYVTDSTAARLARGQVAAVALFASPDTDAATLAAHVRAALADWPQLRVLTGDARRTAEVDPDAGLLLAAGTLLGETAGIAGVVSAFMVAGTFAFTAAQRRREFALLRTAGATPRQVRGLVLGEALGVGVLGGFAGCALAVATAPPFAHWLARVGLAPADFTARFALWPLAAAFTLGLLAALAGAWTTARRASRVLPLEALRAASVDRRTMTPGRWVLGLACIAGAILVTPMMRTTEGAAYLLLVALLLILGCALAAPALAPPLVRLLSAGTRSPAGLLARHSALAAARRTASTATPALITISLAGATLAGTATLSAAQARSVRDHVIAPAVVVAAGQAALSDAITAEAGRAPGVTAAVPVKQTFAYDRDEAMIRQRPAWYIDGPMAAHTLRLPLTAGTLADLTSDTVAVSRSMAEAHGWAIGTQADLWLGDGAPVRLRVVATLEDGLGLPAVLLPWSMASAHAALPLPDAIYLALAPAADPAAINNAVRPLGGQLVPTDTYLSTMDAEFDRLARLALLAVIGMALAYTGISIANTQLMAVAGRANELATLRLLGATPHQLRRIVVREAALASAVGILLAGAITAGTLAAITTALSPVLSTVPIMIPWPPLIAITISCGLVASLASLAPTTWKHRAGRPGGSTVPAA